MGLATAVAVVYRNTMKVLSLTHYIAGYTGICERDGGYLLFCLPRRKPLREIHFYPGEDFRNLNHFKSVITKFIPSRSFLKAPMPVSGLTTVELDRVARKFGLGPVSRKDSTSVEAEGLP